MPDYLPIPESNTTRNENELRAVIDSLGNTLALMEKVTTKQAGMGTDAEFASFYNLTDVAAAAQLRSIFASANGELQAGTFTQQLLQNYS